MTKKAFRDFLHDLEDAGEIQRVARPVDPRDLSGLAAQTDKAVLFDEIEGYPGWRVATALLSSRRRLAITLDCAEDRIAQEFETRSARAIAPDHRRQRALPGGRDGGRRCRPRGASLPA